MDIKRKDDQVHRLCAESQPIPFGRLDMLLKNPVNTSGVYQGNPPKEPRYLPRPQSGRDMLNNLGNRPELADAYHKTLAKTAPKIRVPKGSVASAEQTYLNTAWSFGKALAGNVFRGSSAVGLIAPNGELIDDDDASELVLENNADFEDELVLENNADFEDRLATRLDQDVEDIDEFDMMTQEEGEAELLRLTDESLGFDETPEGEGQEGAENYEAMSQAQYQGIVSNPSMSQLDIRKQARASELKNLSMRVQQAEEDVEDIVMESNIPDVERDIGDIVMESNRGLKGQRKQAKKERQRKTKKQLEAQLFDRERDMAGRPPPLDERKISGTQGRPDKFGTPRRKSDRMRRPEAYGKDPFFTAEYGEGSSIY